MYRKKINVIKNELAKPLVGVEAKSRSLNTNLFYFYRKIGCEPCQVKYQYFLGMFVYCEAENVSS